MDTHAQHVAPRPLATTCARRGIGTEDLARGAALALVLVLVAGLGVSLAACGGSDRAEPKVTAVRAEQFKSGWNKTAQGTKTLSGPTEVGAAVTPGGAAPDIAESVGEPESPALSPVGLVRSPGVRAMRSASAVERGDELEAVRVVVGAPALAASATAPAALGPAVSADAMVGQINGKPVFASELLDPLDGRLAALTREVKTPQLWTRRAGEMIGNALIERVRNELVVAEARNRLSAEERAGLLNLVGRLQSFFQAQAGGSLEQAREDLQSRTGEESLDRILADERDQILIRRLFNETVEPNVRVPWTAVERYYRDNPAQFKPAGEAVFRVVMIDASDEAALTQAAAAAEDDAAFTELASSNTNGFLREKGGERRLPLSKPLIEQELLGSKAINDRALALPERSTVGPLEFGGQRKVWVRRMADNRPAQRSFDQAQLDIVAALINARRGRETAEFTQTLLGTSSYTPIEPMVQQLINIAIARHQRVDLGPAITPAEQERAREAMPADPGAGMGAPPKQP